MKNNKPEVVTVCEDKIREEFEAWLFEFLDNEDMEYVVKARAMQNGQSIYLFEDDDEATTCITAMWVAWRASRAALSIELPESYPRHRDSYIDVMDAELVVEAIEEAGVMVRT